MVRVPGAFVLRNNGFTVFGSIGAALLLSLVATILLGLGFRLSGDLRRGCKAAFPALKRWRLEYHWTG